MGQKLHNHIENWKKLLLDFGKRNRLINFLEGKRSNVKISMPSFDNLWEAIAVNERELVFPQAKSVSFDDYLQNYTNFKPIKFIKEKSKEKEDEEDDDDKKENIIAVILEIKGDIVTNKDVLDLDKTLKNLRYKANTSIEEQGINTLYLTFGMLKWKERDDSSKVFSSPVILVPVKLLIESLTSPYRLVMHDDEIVVNPTLSHKLNNDFGITMPEFDSANDSPSDYLEKLLEKVKNKGWDVEKSTHLTNLSFLKINMYKDLERNEEKLNSNSIISALVGEQNSIQISEELNNFDHDKRIRPIDSFHVVDADSSQQDAVLLSKKGASFVLQGPPGTGKSQTITNIIAEAIADGKKVLFVSEKMAALQVVYSRLASVGLADFCFTLHSHKAKKKDILRDLASSINIDRTRVRDEALAQLDLLERKRNQLNEYQEELHTRTSGLNISIYSVNGELAKLENIPDVIFAIPDTDKVTVDILNERKYLLNELSKTIGKRSEGYYDNVWRGSSVKFLSNALRHEIDSHVATAVPLMKELAEQHVQICSKLGIKLEPSLISVDDLISILTLAGKSPTIPVEWITNHNIDSLIDSARKYKEQVEQIVNTKKALNDIYNDCIFDIDAVKHKDKLSSLICQLKTKLKGDNFCTLSQNIDLINNESNSISDINSLYNEAKKIASNLGISAPNTIDQFIVFIKSMQALVSIYNLHPTSKWFDDNELVRIKSEIKIHESSHNTLFKYRESILSRFDKEILEWEFYPVLQRFRGEYKSFFRVFNGQYRKDIKQLIGFLSNGGNLSYSDALEVLNELKVLSDSQEAIMANKQQYSEDYGSYYAGVNTKWNELYNELETFEASVHQLHAVTSQLKKIITQGQLPISNIIQFNVDCKHIDIESIITRLSSILKFDFNRTTEWNDIRSFAEKTISTATEFISEHQDLMKMRKEWCNYESVISDLDSLISLNVLESELGNQKSTIHKLYKDYYNGFDTDWDKLVEALKYAGEFREAISLFNLPKSFVRDICENSNTISYCCSESQTMSSKRDALKKDVEWFTSLFNNGKDFYKYNILDLANRMVQCKEKKYLLEEWVDYCSNLEKCNKAGLSEYAKIVEEVELDINYIVDAYLKRFYRLWLDAVLPKFPAVQNFRGRIHTQTINEFCELDKGQFKIAQARVRERALNRIPDFNAINGARDEIAILKRELNKQRRLMPLRKLFMAIPNLITSLRPCFMMSPLSVSVFLEAQSYDFDLVIFDEASQVHTEDAIGAIMRGKQVIIVGDTKQLPPTSFFSTSLNDDEFDVDSDEMTEDNDAGAYESILDEAVTVLPERSLRWHYRSRHEHLIAFSNIKIYNNQLITFPSSIEKATDCGVEYVYVKDGVYDRGKKKNNVIEAAKVADLVFEHFLKYPNRSLGVVTFSEAQQNAVDAAIRKKRLQNPYFDKFFIEDKEEPFFIKNLENVQGDERDTIIFSIGYAKDSKGIMYMNFGPLSREGGYRRLNVAITRAKYNVKLVGSIVPTDIDLDKVSSEGVKMLRSYIEFAQQGIIALEKELSFTNSLDFDSPFEEAVYDFLQSKGYNVITQVGCSGFRIDMAVKHPTLNGKFAIGIECDGATYHSSRTARERDRLRQTVLEDMGWTIYRIWSTDWIKDQKSEKEKLINAIEKALGHAIEVAEENVIVNDINKSSIDSITPVIEIEEKIEPSEIINEGYGFELYKRAFPLNLDNKRSKAEIAWDIISLEQPIHFEELCRRIAPAYGRQKATSVVRNEVKIIFKLYLNEKIIEDVNGFLWVKNHTDVKVRVPNPDDDYLRPITYICDEELALAMKTIAQRSFGITPEDLFIVTAREFGFKRTGENIINSLSNVYKQMLNKKEVTEIDGKVQVVS